MKQFKKAQRRQDRRRYKIRQVSGDRLRLSVYRSNENIYLQLIDDKLGKTIVCASSLEKDFDKKLKGKQIATEVGKKLAERAKVQGVEKVVFDCGRYKYHGRIACAADGARAGGLSF